MSLEIRHLNINIVTRFHWAVYRVIASNGVSHYEEYDREWEIEDISEPHIFDETFVFDLDKLKQTTGWSEQEDK